MPRASGWSPHPELIPGALGRVPAPRVVGPGTGPADHAAGDASATSTSPRATKVLMLYGSGNRDEREFGADADRLDITREIKRHLAFSSGAHFCIGSHFARLQARVAFEELLARQPAHRGRHRRRPAAALVVHARLALAPGHRRSCLECEEGVIGTIPTCCKTVTRYSFSVRWNVLPPISAPARRRGSGGDLGHGRDRRRRDRTSARTALGRRQGRRCSARSRPVLRDVPGHLRRRCSSARSSCASSSSSRGSSPGCRSSRPCWWPSRSA